MTEIRAQCRLTAIGPEGECPVSGAELGEADIRTNRVLRQPPPTFQTFRLPNWQP